MKAYDLFLEDFCKKRRAAREDAGDFLGMPKPVLYEHDDAALVFASFASLLQGDHLGVEFACCAHGALLEEAGCHPAENRLCNLQPILHNKPVTGLVIDDFFALSAESIRHAAEDTYAGPSASFDFLQVAKAAYDKEGVIGSDDKEVSNALLFKVIGAEVNSLPAIAREGLVSLGAPGDKRFGLMMLSALVANLPYTSG